MKRLAVIIIAMSSLLGTAKNTTAQAAVGISVEVAPPALPVYTQPPCPEEGFLWTPGYWYWGANGYFWVPGVWCRPAHIGWLWTPGYWGWGSGHYWWHGGYWGEHVGYYGGVCYGYGYGGHGFYGGRWEGGAFRYNTAVWSVGGGFHNTYVDRTVINNTNVNRTSFNGPNGIHEEPNAEERTAMNEQHMQATTEQMNHEHSASANRNQLYSTNHGNPSVTAKSAVGGQKFNPSGHAMQAAHANNAAHMNGGQQHAMQNRSNMQPHSTMQNRGGGMQRQAQPARSMQRGGGHASQGGPRGGKR